MNNPKPNKGIRIEIVHDPKAPTPSSLREILEAIDRLPPSDQEIAIKIFSVVCNYYYPIVQHFKEQLS